jgi:hypothetical protein
LREHFAAKRVALIASGGNATREQLLDVLTQAHAMTPEAFRVSAAS